MKRLLPFILIVGFACQIDAQVVNYYNVTAGNGYGYRFWNGSDYFKMHFGNTSEFHYGPVQSYSIKMNMSTETNRGWTWGIHNQTPIAALSTTGQFQLAGAFYAMGNVGINTTAPTEKLELSNGSIYGFNSSDAFVKIKRRQGQASIKGVYDGTSGYDGHVIIDAGRTSDAVFLNHYISSNVYLVNGGGKVGIGTSTPENKLTVLGQFGLYGSGLDGSTYQRFVLYSDAQNGLYFDAPKDANGNKLPIEFNWRGGGTTPLRINGDGNVGIGTTTPGEKLTVKGKIHTEEVRVDLSVPAPDYVFADNYNLPTLESIEAFIKSEKHLPEIPSAKEMEENGVELGTMNMLLLKKIEELTLYQIEMMKIINKQQREIEDLQQ